MKILAEQEPVHARAVWGKDAADATLVRSAFPRSGFKDNLLHFASNGAGAA
jgi:hypothetical protein